MQQRARSVTPFADRNPSDRAPQAIKSGKPPGPLRGPGSSSSPGIARRTLHPAPGGLTIGLPMPQTAVAAPARLLERDREVERLRTALGAVEQRAGSAVVIEGDAGIGKSTLLEEARARASDLGFRFLNAHATNLEQRFPFGVVRQLFERPLLQTDAAERDRWLAGAAALAAEVVTSAPTSASEAPAPGQAAADSAYAWQHGLYWLASNLSLDSPLLLVVDDLQWCDAPSARAVGFIARR